MLNESIIQSLFSRCSSVDFGVIASTSGRDELLRRLNSAIIELVRSLPRSMQTEAMLFVMSYAGLRLGDELDLFRNYYPPIWSCLWWIIQVDNVQCTKEFIDAAASAQALAMMLHSLDDHLCDGEVPVSLLTLLLRSQTWLRMHDSVVQLAETVPSGNPLVTDLLNDYYAGITDKDGAGDLNEYCTKFEKQMALGLIVPSLLARMIEGCRRFQSNLEEKLRASLVRFGVAWRLLDDIRDIEEDMRFGRKTGVYLLLSGEGQALWGGTQTSGKESKPYESVAILAGMIQERNIIEILVGRIVDELHRAVAYAKEAGLHGLASEYLALAEPLMRK